MLYHVFIWEADGDSNALKKGMEANRWEMHLIQPALEKQAAEDWKKHFQLVQQQAMQQLEVTNKNLDGFVVNVVLSAEYCEEAYQRLCDIHCAADEVFTLPCRMHIMFLTKRFSEHAQQQKEFWKRLRDDARNCENFQLEKKKKEDEIQLRHNEEYQDAEKRVSTIDELQSLQTRQQQEKAAELKAFADAYKEKNRWLEWEYLSILCDCTENGGMIGVSDIRDDILAGVAMRCDWDELDTPHRCRTYQIQRSDFSVGDIRQLPLLLAKAVNSTQKKTANQLESEFQDGLSREYKELVKELRERSASWPTALLVDDNNYENRNGLDLWNEFEAANGLEWFVGDMVSRHVRRWLDDAKRLLAQSVDVEPQVRKYIEAGNIFVQNGITNPNRGNLSRYCFGSAFSVAKRMKSMESMISIIRELVAYQCAEQIRKEVEDARQELLEWLDEMERSNSELFGDNNNLLAAFSNETWMQTARSKLHYRELQINDTTLDNYKQWLSDSLKQNYLFELDLAKLNEQASQSYTAIAQQAARKSEAFTICLDGFGLQPNALRAMQPFAGASGRLYLLKEFKCNPCLSDDKAVDKLFLANATVNQPTAQQSDGAEQIPVGAIMMEKQPELKHDATTGLCSLQGYWPKGVAFMDVTITAGMGQKPIYQEKIVRRGIDDYRWSSSKLSLPTGHELRLCIQNGLKKYECTYPALEAESLSVEYVELSFLQKVKNWLLRRADSLAHYRVSLGNGTVNGYKLKVCATMCDNTATCYPIPSNADNSMELIFPEDFQSSTGITASLEWRN